MLRTCLRGRGWGEGKQQAGKNCVQKWWERMIKAEFTLFRIKKACMKAEGCYILFSLYEKDVVLGPLLCYQCSTF